jgi:hypothetical protein
MVSAQESILRSLKGGGGDDRPTVTIQCLSIARTLRSSILRRGIPSSGLVVSGDSFLVMSETLTHHSRYL